MHALVIWVVNGERRSNSIPFLRATATLQTLMTRRVSVCQSLIFLLIIPKLLPDWVNSCLIDEGISNQLALSFVYYYDYIASACILFFF